MNAINVLAAVSAFIIWAIVVFGIIAMLSTLPACCSHQRPQIEMPTAPAFQYHEFH